MKKLSKSLVVAAVAVATVAAILVGCKKEKNEEMAAKANNSEVQAMLDRIEAFHALRDAVNSGQKAEGTMTVEEMRKTLCLISNYEHSEHEKYCLNTTLDTLRVAMPEMDEAGFVREADVVAVYDAFERSLQSRMENIQDEMDVPSLFSIVLPKAGMREEDSISIVFTRGEETEQVPVMSPSVSGPFSNVCYYWGLGMERCDGGPCIPNSDATTELTRYFKFDYSAFNGSIGVVDVEYVNYVATNSFSIYHSDWTYWEPSTYEIPCNTWLFWQSYATNATESEPCLCEDMLNCEYSGINTHIASSTGAKHYSPNNNLPYFECEVLDKTVKLDDEIIIGRVHVAQVTYANYIFTPNQDK